MKKVILFFIVSFILSGQSTKRVLFIGNSYTYGNNLPELLKNIAISTNDNVIHDSSTPGGSTLQSHTTNTTTTGKIIQGNWDFVVLQEQSQRPSFAIAQVEADVYPYATQLNNLINLHNPCAETVFYMTWGRKNGDASNCTTWPPVCTYEGMDDLLRERYMAMGLNNSAIVSPVGVVWRNLRNNYPQLELYESDNSHPSFIGSYAAAITFYTVIFRKDPTNITFNSSLSSQDANIIKQTVKQVVFQNFNTYFVENYDPNANFTENINLNTVNFTNNSQNAVSYSWDFGDGNTSIAINPTHIYNAIGNYTVKLTATKCGLSKVKEKAIIISNLNTNNYEFEKNIFYPNPSNNIIWFSNNVEINNIKIYDLLGKKIEIEYDNPTRSINISHLENGTYILNINSNDKNINFKILKN